MSFLENAFDEASRKGEYLLDQGRKAVSAGVAPQQVIAGGYSGLLGEISYQRDANQHAEQFRHNRDRVHSVVKFIALRMAKQQIRVARVVSNPDEKTTKALTNYWSKATSGTSLLRRDHLPERWKALADEGKLEPYTDHELLRVLADPNSIMTSWGLRYITAAQLEITGKACWWVYRSRPANQQARQLNRLLLTSKAEMVSANVTPGPYNEPSAQIWPLPASWLTPIHTREKLFSAWKIRPSNMAQEFTIDGDDLVYFYYPDPSDLMSADSTLQAQSRAVASDQAIVEVQRETFKNSCWPHLLITIGRHPSLANVQGERPMLTDIQRNEIIGWVKSMYRGLNKYNEPLIQDALIEAVKELGQGGRELDFLKSGVATQQRIDEGFFVNPISMGRVEGANRASATMANENVNENNINPKIEHTSEVMTEWLGPMFAAPGEKLVVYAEQAKTSDPEYMLEEDATLINGGAILFNELRVRHNLPRIEALEDYLVTPQGLTPVPGSAAHQEQEAAAVLENSEPLAAPSVPPEKAATVVQVGSHGMKRIYFRDEKGMVVGHEDTPILFNELRVRHNLPRIEALEDYLVPPEKAATVVQVGSHGMKRIYLRDEKGMVVGHEDTPK